VHPDQPMRNHGSNPEGHFGRGPVEISLISAVRTHALCTHAQDHLVGPPQLAHRQEPQLRGHVSARTPCTRMRTQR